MLPDSGISPSGDTARDDAYARMAAVFRVVLAVLLLAACTESDMHEVPTTGFGIVVTQAEEIIAAFPPLCEALRTQGYETRKVSFDEASETSHNLAGAACPDDISRLRDARAVEAAAATIGDDAVTVEFTRCAGTRTGFAVTVAFTNTADRSVGVVAAVRSTVEDQPTGLGVATTVWHIEPGQTVTRELEASTRGGTGCSVTSSTFLSDPDLTGDASGVATGSDELTSDDPAVWYPALVAAEQEWWTAGDASLDSPATTEDLRSLAYPGLVDHVRAGGRGEPLDGTASVCGHSAHPDNPNFVRYVAVLDELVVAGAARRGADSRWRSLGTGAVVGTGECPT